MGFYIDLDFISHYRIEKDGLTIVNVKSHMTKNTYGWANLTIGWEDLSKAIQVYYEQLSMQGTSLAPM